MLTANPFYEGSSASTWAAFVEYLNDYRLAMAAGLPDVHGGHGDGDRPALALTTSPILIGCSSANKSPAGGLPKGGCAERINMVK